MLFDLSASSIASKLTAQEIAFTPSKAFQVAMGCVSPSGMGLEIARFAMRMVRGVSSRADRQGQGPGLPLPLPDT